MQVQISEYNVQKKIKSTLFRIQARAVDERFWHVGSCASLGRIQLLALRWTGSKIDRLSSPHRISLVILQP